MCLESAGGGWFALQLPNSILQLIDSARLRIAVMITSPCWSIILTPELTKSCSQEDTNYWVLCTPKRPPY